MSAWAQARWFTWLTITLFLASWVALALVGLRTFILLAVLTFAIQVAALLLCRCPACGKPLHWRGGIREWPDLFLPRMRPWPEERCSRCGANLLVN